MPLVDVVTRSPYHPVASIRCAHECAIRADHEDFELVSIKKKELEVPILTLLLVQPLLLPCSCVRADHEADR